MKIEGIYHVYDSEFQYCIGTQLHIEVRIHSVESYVSDPQMKHLIPVDEKEIRSRGKATKYVTYPNQALPTAHLIEGKMYVCGISTVVKLDNGFKIPLYMLRHCIARGKTLREEYHICDLTACLALEKGKKIITEASILSYIEGILPHTPSHEDYIRILFKLYDRYNNVNVCKKKDRKSVSPFSLMDRDSFISLIDARIEDVSVTDI